MNKSGTAIPTAWLLILPIANIIWLWKYSVGVEVFTRRGLGKHAAFWLMFLLGSFGSAIVQSKFNEAMATAPARMRVGV
jgi:1,4-dihydroxy-2-naphthoate octaprenyltransferase